MRGFFNAKGKIYKEFTKKLSIILQNPRTSSDPIFDHQHRATWNRIKNVITEWRNYIHISKLVKEQNPLDEKSIKNFYGDFESTINILLNLNDNRKLR